MNSIKPFKCSETEKDLGQEKSTGNMGFELRDLIIEIIHFAV